MLAKLKEHWQFITLFILSTSFFIYQHTINHQLWDFYVYLMNGKYWFHNGFYFELYRAPLAPLMLGLLGGNLFAEYAFIVLVSALFAIVTYFLSKKLEIDEVTFYALLLNIFLLFEGMANGTELLSLVFLELGILLILIDDFKSGIAFALATLARYTMLPYSILILFHKNWKKILIAILLAVATFLPWLIYNKIYFGNYFASMADSYALNVYFRGYMVQPPKLIDFLVVGNVLWIPFAIGLTKFKMKKEEIIFLVVFAIAIFNYVTTPLKIPRYLFPLILPIAFFSSKVVNKKIAVALFLAMLITAFILQPAQPPFYEKPIEKIKSLGLENCEIESNLWPLLDYAGLPTEPNVHPDIAQKEIENGKIMVLYKNVEGFANVTPVIYDGGSYIIAGYKNCTKMKTPIVYIYLNKLNYNNELEGKNKTYSYCDVFFPKICYLINKI